MQVSETTRLKTLSGEHLFYASEDGLIILNTDFQVLELNAVAQAFLGSQDNLSYTLSCLLEQQSISPHLLWQTALQFPWEKDQLTFEFSSIPLKAETGQLEGALIRLKNLATQKLFEHHLDEAQWRYSKLLAVSERRAEEIALLHSVRDALNNAHDRLSICQLVVQRSSEIYGYNLLSLYLIEGEELHMQYQVGYETFIERLSMQTGVMGKVARTGQAALINPENPDPDLIWAFEGIQAEVCVPIVVNQRVIGVFNIESLDTNLTEADLSLAKTLAGYISTAFERIQLLEALQEREKIYRELVENADDIIYNISLSGYFLYVNPVTEKLTGYSQDQLKKMHFLQLIRKDYQASAMVLYEEQFKKRLETSHFVFPLITAKGEERWLSQKVRLVWKEDRILHMQAYSRDMTEQVHAEQALAAHTKALERANRDLEKFSFITAHDLQEPLRKIRTFSDRLNQKYAQQFDDQGKLYLSRMSQAASRMQNLVEDVQLFSFIGTELKEEPVDLNCIVETWIKQHAPLLEQINALIAVATLPVLKADTQHIRLLIDHLLSNALKFRRADIALKVELQAKVAGEWLELEILDNGQGFDEAYLDKIFEVFQTLHSDKENLGNGMGLALCRKIVAVYGGTISVSSKLENGSSFCIRLPQNLINGLPAAAERLVNA